MSREAGLFTFCAEPDMCHTIPVECKWTELALAGPYAIKFSMYTLFNLTADCGYAPTTHPQPAAMHPGSGEPSGHLHAPESALRVGISLFFHQTIEKDLAGDQHPPCVF